MATTQAGIGTLPPDLYEQQQALNRQQQMAQLLLQQGQTMPTGQMVSGRFVAPSFFQYAAPLAQTFAATRLSEKGDKQAAELAKALRQRYADEAKQYKELLEGKEAVFEQAGPTQTGGNIPNQVYRTGADPQAAYLFGSTAYNPALQQIALKKLTDGPKWEKAEIDMPDGSVKKGWVNYNSANPLSTFIEGGTKPAFNVLEGARFQYETGMPLPTGGARPQANQPVSPYGGNVQFTPNQAVSPAVRPQPAGAPVSSAPVGNQPTMTQASYTGAPNMSPQARNEANKQIFVENEKARQESLRNLPTDLNRAEQAIATVDQMIGSAMPNEKASFGWETKDKAKQPHAGFTSFVGATYLPFARFVEGSDTASFQTLYDSLKGQAFLEAFQRLKGAGAITEVEGEKATTALLKLNKAQNEADFVKYAREFQDNLRKGMELAKQRAGAPNSAGQKPVLRWNPQKNAWE